jgi:Ca-activated chloride channel family protein
MTFIWPDLLWLTALLPVAVLLYVMLLRRKKRASLRYASLTLLRDAMSKSSIRRHVPPVLFLISLALMLVAIARPAAVLTLPSQHET